MNAWIEKLFFGGTIFLSSFLLFLIQPIVSKYILPWYGGSSAVWTTCMVFFQVTLLLGYAYSDRISRNLRPSFQILLHGGLIAISVLTLHVLADASLKPNGSEDPTISILALLVLTIGLPYFLLSTTGPLVQSWAAKVGASAKVYRYFSLSNLSSLVALVSYPFLIEPNLALATQAGVWSIFYFFFSAFCIASGIYFYRKANVPPGNLPVELNKGLTAQIENIESSIPRVWDYLLWVSLAAMGSWLLLAVTNHITQNIAPIPLLWLLPLCVYLLTFTMAFESDRWYTRRRCLPVTLIIVTLCSFGLQSHGWPDSKTGIPLYLIGLFFACLFLHGELAKRRPTPKYLTRFYLMLSLGGAVGGVTVGLIAPRFFSGYYEVGLGFIIVMVLASWIAKKEVKWAIASTFCAVTCVYFLYSQIVRDITDARVLNRNFYGTMETNDSGLKGSRDEFRELYHGSVVHGKQYLDPQRRKEATLYYGQTAGIGLAINNVKPGAKRLGLIGLGAGTLAVYGKEGDYLRFYEINPQVIEVAQSEFSFIKNSKAKVDIVLGDARLALEKESPNQFDVLVVDAFSGDSLPIHLITLEAVQLYLRQINQNGVLAFHVTNHYLSLAPVLEQIAKKIGLYCVLIHDGAINSSLYTTDWVLISKKPRVLASDRIQKAAIPIKPISGLAPWTDDFNNLVQVLK